VGFGVSRLSGSRIHASISLRPTACHSPVIVSDLVLGTVAAL
jgi:hypothetical protein